MQYCIFSAKVVGHWTFGVTQGHSVLAYPSSTPGAVPHGHRRLSCMATLNGGEVRYRSFRHKLRQLILHSHDLRQTDDTLASRALSLTGSSPTLVQCRHRGTYGPDGPSFERALNFRVWAHPCPPRRTRVGIFGPSTFTFPIVLESKPPPFEDHKGWGTRKSQTSPSALRYRNGIIQPREFLNRKARKDGPPAYDSSCQYGTCAGWTRPSSLFNWKAHHSYGIFAVNRNCSNSKHTPTSHVELPAKEDCIPYHTWSIEEIVQPFARKGDNWGLTGITNS